MSRWINYAGALMLILAGVSFYSYDSSFPPAGITTLALLMIIVGLVWAGLALNNLLREQRHRRRSRDGSLRVVPALSARYRGHRDSSRRVPDRRFTAKGPRWPHGAVGKSGIAMNALADVTFPSLVKHTLRMAAKESKENLCDARGSMWAVLCATVLTLTSSDLMFADKELSPLGRSENLYVVTSVAVGLGLLVAGLFAADSVVVDEKQMALDETMPTPTKRGALLLTRVLSVMAMWLLIFVISAPYIVVVGFGTGVTWVALTHALVLGTLCVVAFATIIVGLVALSRSGRGATLVFSATFATLTLPTFLGIKSGNSLFGDIYNVLSPFAQTRMSLAGAIMDKEGLLVQLPHIATLAAFAVIVGTFVACATRGDLRRRGEWREGRGDRKPWDLQDATSTERTGPRPVDQDPEKTVER